MSTKNDGGKGSSPRPFSVSQDEYEKRWDAIFQRDLKQEDVASTEDSITLDMPGTLGSAKVTFNK